MVTIYNSISIQFAPTIIIPKPNQIAVLIGNLAWDVDLVAVEVVGLLSAFAVFVVPVAYLCQRVRNCRIVGVGNGFGQPLGVVAVICGVTNKREIWIP